MLTGAVVLTVASGAMNLVRDLVRHLAVKRRPVPSSVPPGDLLIGVFETADGPPALLPPGGVSLPALGEP